MTDRAAAKKILADAAQKRSAIVISDEVLTLGDFVHPATRWPVHPGHITTARWARAVLGEANVLIVLRNQADWLESWHRQGLKTGKYVETDYRAWLSRDLGLSAERLLTLLDYEMLYQAYRQEFGSQRVCVRFYEDYRNRFEDLAAECARLIDVDIDRARRLIRDGDARNVTGNRFTGHPPFVRRLAAAALVRRILDTLPAGVRRWLREVLVRERTYRRLSEADRAAIRDRFAASNARLLQALGLKNSPGAYQYGARLILGFDGWDSLLGGPSRSVAAHFPPSPTEE
jgi:hypothetical protein